MLNKWESRFRSRQAFPFGDELSYIKASRFLNGHGRIEDWGCGTAWARRYFENYVGIDGTAGFADLVVDLRTYHSTSECIHIRHVLEHNLEWQVILTNALESFSERLVLTVFTPLDLQTHLIGTTVDAIPEISFSRSALVNLFEGIGFYEEDFSSLTFYGKEHMFYLDKRRRTQAHSV
jgi:hypothetical protein